MADPSLPDGFTLDAAPAPAHPLPDGFQLDSAADMAKAWRARTGAPADVPTPFDSGLPASIPQRSFADKAEQFSSAAGDTLTAGLIQAKTGMQLAAAGIPTLLGDQSAADTQFANVQRGSEEAARLQAQGAGQNRAGAVTGNVLSFVPYIMGGEAALPARAAEVTGLIPRAAAAATRALPTAATLGTQQAEQQALGVANAGGTGAQAEKAYLTALPTDTAVNLLPTGVPGALPLRMASGAALAAGGQAASQEIQHAVSPQYVPKPTWDQASEGGLVGALMAAAFGHGAAEPTLPVDPYLGNYAKGSAEPPATAPVQRALPPPTTETPSVAAPPTPSGESGAASTKQAPSPQEAFLKDPVTALQSLDHATVKQIAEDAGFDIKPGDTKPSIINKIMGQGHDYLESDVLPEYLANLPKGTGGSSAVSQPAEPTPKAPANEQQEPSARAIQPGVVVPVDRSGTAYTPEQGMQSFRQALDEAMPQRPGLPSPVTTVDRAGTAIDSSAFSRALAEQRDAEQRQLDLGLTPDIRRAQIDRAATAGTDEVIPQREDFAPTDNVPWWAAGQYQDAAHQAALTALRDEVPRAPAPLSPATPVDATHDIPLGGGVAADNSKVYISKEIPQFIDVPGKDGQPVKVDAWDVIAHHEEAEKPQLDKGTHYYDAHEGNANAYEAAYVEAKYGVTHDAFNDALEPYLQRAEEHGSSSKDIPADLDTKPYVDGGDEAMLKSASPELSKLGIPDELHPQAMEFLAHVERALDAGIPVEHLRDIASSDTDLPSKLTQIDSLIGETGHAHPVDAETESVPRETAEAPLRQAGEAGQPSAQQRSAEVGHAEDTGEQQSTVPDRSDQLAQPDGSASGGVPIQWRRADWTPQVEGRAITEIDSLVQRYGGSTLADSIAQDLRESTTAQLIGQQIHGPEDLAALASVYRNPAFETMRYVYVDRAGNILGETAVSSRMPSSTKAFPTGTDNGAVWVKDNAPSGATGIWLIHNHPSGNPRASDGDLRVTESLGLYLGDMAGAPKLQGHVILDHDTYGHIDALGFDQGVKPLHGAAMGDITRSPRGDTRMFDLKVGDADYAAVTGKRIAAATPANSSALVIMDAQRRVVSVHTFPNDFLATPRGAAMIGRLGGKRGAVGVGLVTDATSFAKYRGVFEKATQRGLLRDAIVVSPKGTPLNLAGTKLFPKELRQNFGKQSAATQNRTSAAVRAFEQQPTESTPMVSLSTVRRVLAERGLSEEQIKAMSPDQLRTEQANLRRRSAPAPEEIQTSTTTGIKDATVEEERAMKGKAAVEHDLSRSNPEAFAEAKRRIAADPQYGTKLAQSIIDRPRPHTQEEAMALALDRMRIINDRRSAFDAVQEAKQSGDGSQEAAARARVQILDSQMEANDRAAEMSGHETGAALQARKTMVKDDYTMAALISQGKQRAGRELTSGEREALEQRALDIERREKALAEREQALREAKREPRKPAERQTAKAKFDSLAEQLKAIAKKDQMKPGCVV